MSCSQAVSRGTLIDLLLWGTAVLIVFTRWLQLLVMRGFWVSRGVCACMLASRGGVGFASAMRRRLCACTYPFAPVCQVTEEGYMDLASLPWTGL